MALVHERIYQSTDLSGINLRDYLKFLSNQVLRFYGIRGNKVRISVDLPDVVTDIDTTIPLGLIMNELLSNSFKHAFPGTRPGTIRISGSSSEGTLAVEYHDDGIGIPENLDWKNADSLGLRLVISLVEQLRGTINLDRAEGTTFRFTIQTKKEKG
jgi:two-component sensor histidine kinase